MDGSGADKQAITLLARTVWLAGLRPTAVPGHFLSLFIAKGKL